MKRFAETMYAHRTATELRGIKQPFPIRYSTVRVISIIALLCALTTGFAFAALITFDDLPTPPNGGTAVVPNGYAALNWSNVYYLNATNNNLGGGYNNAVVSRANVAFMGYDDLGQFVLVSGPAFDFVSAWLTAAWRNGLNIRVRGYSGGQAGTLLYDRTVIVNTSGPTSFNFNYLGIDTLRFDPSGGKQGPYGDGGRHFVFDDMTVRFAGEPTAQNLSLDAAANRTTSFALQASDPDGDPLTFLLDSSPSHGFLSAPLGTMSTYTPKDDYLGPDSFQYVVSDGRFISGRARVNITVKPGLIINNASVTEGNSGTKAATFTVTMTAPGVENVDVNFRTADGTAKAGSDYLATSDGLIFHFGGNTEQTITIPVIGDRLVEFNETFLVQLFNPTPKAVIVVGTGRCTILDDDSVTLSRVGTAALAPENSVVEVGEPVNLSLTWTHPVGWRQLDSVDLLLVDDEGETLAVRWHEAENSFSLFNPAADRFTRMAKAGSPTRFDTSAVTLDLEQSTGGGPATP